MESERLYTVQEVFEVLQTNKITSHIESVRRWLRQGKIEGVAPVRKKDGWKVTQSALDRFLAERLPENLITTNDVKENNETNVVIDRESIRAEMWYQITSKNIWEGYIPIKRSLLKEAAEHRYYTPELVEKVWERCVANSSTYKQPRISYLLDAFSFEGERVLLDKNFTSLEEQIVYALIEHVKAKLHQARRKTIKLQIGE